MRIAHFSVQISAEITLKHFLSFQGALNGMIKDITEDPSVVQRYGQRVENTVRGECLCPKNHKKSYDK